MSKGVKITLIVLAILIILSGAGVGVFYYFKSKTSPEEVPVNKTNVLESIEEYGYSLEDRDTPLFKRTFEELRTILNEETVDFSKYAETLSKLYIIDLYTIDNKINQYDIGSVEFVSPDVKENFELKVKDTIYKYVEDNSYNSRNQELPIVDSITADEVVEENFTIGEEVKPGFKVKLSWVYTKDLGYDKSATITLVKDDKKLYVVKQDVSNN